VEGDLRGPASGSPAILTSLNDNSPFGGTDPSSPADWQGVTYGAGLTAHFQGLTIKHASVGLTADTANITNCTFMQNSTGVVVAKGGGVYRNCTFAQNNMAVRNNSTLYVDARGNWWGDPTGPYNAKSNPGGKGNQVSDYVIVSDFLSAPGSSYGQTHVLWDNVNGAASIWNYSPADGSYTHQEYGPYAGYTAAALADGADGKTRVLWDKTDGSASIWSLDNTAGQFAHFEFGPFTGYTATALCPTRSRVHRTS